MKRTKSFAKVLQHTITINLPIIFGSALLMIALSHADGQGNDGHAVKTNVMQSSGEIYVSDKLTETN